MLLVVCLGARVFTGLCVCVCGGGGLVCYWHLAKWWSFTTHIYKNIIVLCMHVCLGAWWAHASQRPGESRFRTARPR